MTHAHPIAAVRFAHRGTIRKLALDREGVACGAKARVGNRGRAEYL